VRVVAGVQFLRQGISNLIIKSLILAPSHKGVASNEDSHFPRFTWNIRGHFSSPEEFGATAASGADSWLFWSFGRLFCLIAAETFERSFLS
jgi:hypothetical protein